MKSKNQSYVVMNLELGTYYWCDSAASPEEAITEYFKEYPKKNPTERSICIQVVPGTGYKEYSVVLTPSVDVNITEQDA